MKYCVYYTAKLDTMSGIQTYRVNQFISLRRAKKCANKVWHGFNSEAASVYDATTKECVYMVGGDEYARYNDRAFLEVTEE